MTAKSTYLKENPQHWKHLREYKRIFWKAERKAFQQLIRQDIKQSLT